MRSLRQTLFGPYPTRHEEGACPCQVGRPEDCTLYQKGLHASQANEVIQVEQGIHESCWGDLIEENTWTVVMARSTSIARREVEKLHTDREIVGWEIVKHASENRWFEWAYLANGDREVFAFQRHHVVGWND